MEEDKIIKIEITSEPNKTKYFVDDEFDSTGLVVTGSYSDGTSFQITNYELINTSTSTTGTKSVTVLFNDLTAFFSIQVDKKVIESITITKKPNKLIYALYSEFNPEGIEVYATYNNGETLDVTEFVYIDSPEQLNELGVIEIEVFYVEDGLQRKTSFSISVEFRALSYISVIPPYKTEYFLNERFISNGIIVTAHYNDGSEFVIPPTNLNGASTYNLSSVNTSTYGFKTIIVSYTEDGVTKTTTFDIEVVRVKISGIRILKFPQTEFALDEIFTTNELEVEAFYNNGTSKIITNYTINGHSNITSSSGSKMIRLTYTEDSITKEVTYNITVSGSSIPKSEYGEYFQHIRFKMPDTNINLELKWEERLFRINYNFKQIFVINNIIFDIIKIKNNEGKYDLNFDENFYKNKTNYIQRETIQSNFPYYAYPCVMTNDEKIVKNKISIFSSIVNDSYFNFGSLIPSLEELKTDENFGLTLGNYLNDMPPPPIPNAPYKKEVFLNFFMPKSDIDFFLEKGVELDKPRVIRVTFDYGVNQLVLNEGKYTIWMAAGRAGERGQGGNEEGTDWGQYGAGLKFTIEAKQSIILNYKLGQGGGNGELGSKGSKNLFGQGGGRGKDGKGGGGGTSVLIFSSDVLVSGTTPRGNRISNKVIRTIGFNGGDAFDSANDGGSGGGMTRGSGTSAAGGGGGGSNSAWFSSLSGSKGAAGSGGFGGLGFDYNKELKVIEDITERESISRITTPYQTTERVRTMVNGRLEWVDKPVTKYTINRTKLPTHPILWDDDLPSDVSKELVNFKNNNWIRNGFIIVYGLHRD